MTRGGSGRPGSGRATRRSGGATGRARRAATDRSAALRLIPHVHRATHRIALWLERHPDLSVTQAESHILAHLAAAGPSTVADLHQALAHRRSTLTSVLDRLEQRSLVQRVVARGDRRSFEVHLTPPGATLATRVHEALTELELGALGGLGAAELRGLIAALDRLGATRPSRRAGNPARRDSK